MLYEAIACVALACWVAQTVTVVYNKLDAIALRKQLMAIAAPALQLYLRDQSGPAFTVPPLDDLLHNQTIATHQE